MANKGQKEYQSIFDHEYFFHGRHAQELIKLTSQFGDSSSMKLFQRNVDIFMVAPVVGFIYGRRADYDSSDVERTINFAQMVSLKNDIIFNYRLIMLLDKEYEPDSEKRLDKAFRFYGTDKAKDDEKRFEEYMRGGIDVLYEKLVQPGSNFSKNVIDFLEEFNERYINTDSQSLIEVAKSL